MVLECFDLEFRATKCFLGGDEGYVCSRGDENIYVPLSMYAAGRLAWSNSEDSSLFQVDQPPKRLYLAKTNSTMRFQQNQSHAKVGAKLGTE